jgi:hypothetical protein
MNILSHYLYRRSSPAPKARPRLEELESRDVPSYLVADFPGYGVWRAQDGVWQQFTPSDATHVAVDSEGDVVGVFPGHGIWLYSNGTNTWEQINTADASGLAIDYTVFADHRLSWSTTTIYVAETYAGHGVWLFNDATTTNKGSSVILGHSAGVKELTPSSASIVAVNYQGNVLGEFPGYGVWYCQSGGTDWQQWSQSDASSLAMCVSYMVAEFPGQGVWRAQPGFQGWQQLTPSDATAVAVNGDGDVTVAFAGYGVWSYLQSANAAAAGWSMGWHQLTPSDAYAVGIDVNGNVYGAFHGWGTWFDQVGSWQRLTISDPSSVSVGG